MPGTRFTERAAAQLRSAIREVGGMEVFAVGSLDGEGQVDEVEIHARGTEDAVVALRQRPRAGQVVIHNHPSGVLRPSDPDLELAGAFGENGVGFVIVSNDVARARWVVEPFVRTVVRVDAHALTSLFVDRLPAALPGWEPRPGQVEMAIEVARALDEGGVSVLEAGTGTGKSLAYLAPAALWAVANDARVVVSTYTRTLQGQLVAEDLPALGRVLDLRYAVLKGRNNYVCRRKLEQAEEEGGVAALRAWAATSRTGDAAELGFEIDDDSWSRVESDSDQTLRARCPHFNTCFYYQARRTAAAAHVIVVNHALLLADLALKKGNQGKGILPDFDRVVLDEAHHLEEAATQAGACRLSSYGLARAVVPLVGRRARAGALHRVRQRWPTSAAAADVALDAVAEARDAADYLFAGLREEVTTPTRVTGAPPEREAFVELGGHLERAAAALGAVQAALDAEEIPVAEAQAVLDVGRAHHRLEEAASVVRTLLTDDPEVVRWLDPGRRGVAAVHAAVDVAPFLHTHLQEDRFASVLTSATLAVKGDPGHFLGRVGLTGARFRVFPSPFDYREQAVLGLPKDLPRPDDPTFHDVAGDVIAQCIRASGGGAFVLCTSYRAVDELAARVEATLGGRYALLRQGRGSRTKLLERFRDDRAAVLFGTDSFWEGVSVRGEGLRLVIIPRLPFRVPTEPVAQARHERLQQRGLDPFRAWSLPDAVLKLRQGFGRLVRSRTDRGAVVLLDRRIHEMWYGRIFLASLPDATRVVGPARVVVERLVALYAPGGGGVVSSSGDGPGA